MTATLRSGSRTDEPGLSLAALQTVKKKRNDTVSENHPEDIATVRGFPLPLTEIDTGSVNEHRSTYL